MGTQASHIVIRNLTNSPLKADCSDTASFDWDGDQGNPEYTFKDYPVRIPPDGEINKRVELNKIAIACPYKMTLTFKDGSKDTFKVNQKWANQAAPLDVRERKCDHIVVFGRDKDYTTLTIEVMNTELQMLAFSCLDRYDSCQNEYENKQYVSAQSNVGVLLVHIEKIRDDRRKDYFAKELVAKLWKPTHVLLAKIKLGLSRDYKLTSIEYETKNERASSWRYFVRSHIFLEQAIGFSKIGEDVELASELGQILPIYDEKKKCNKLFNVALDGLENFWEKAFQFHEGRDIFNDPVYQKDGYLRKYKRIEDACNRNEDLIREFNKVKDEFMALIAKDNDFKKCVNPVNKIIDLLVEMNPKLRKTHLQIALDALQLEKSNQSDQEEFLWRGEEIVEIEAPGEQSYL